MNWNIDKDRNNIEQLRTALAEADSVVVGAGAGLSTAAGLTYNGERFERYFFDFAEKYQIKDNTAYSYSFRIEGLL
jgi:NAD-dependent SIR2 family protein deacetylase